MDLPDLDRNVNLTLHAGDILTACDNELNVPPGYLGHSAIALNDTYIVEAVIRYPYIQIATKKSFWEPHPKSAVYRPLHPGWGQAAARYAYQYYLASEHFKKQGVIRPPFSFSQDVPLQDPWTSVYCSKLVWLSYYYGAGYAIKNDFGLFTPEDLDTFLSVDPNFTRLYKHPAFHFEIDT